MRHLILILILILVLALALPAVAEEPKKTIEIDRSGKIAFEGRAVTLDELNAALSALDRASTTFVVRADDRVAYSHLQGVLGLLNSSGVKKILFARLEPKAEEAKLAEINAKCEAAARAQDWRALATLYLERAKARIALGRELEQAAKDIDEAIRLNPSTAEAYTQRGTLARAWGRHQQALVDYERALALDPRQAQAWYSRGMARSALGDLKSAIEDYQRAIELDPANAEYRRCLDQARAVLSRGQALTPLGKGQAGQPGWQLARPGQFLAPGVPGQPATHVGTLLPAGQVRIRLRPGQGGPAGSVLRETAFKDAADLERQLCAHPGVQEVVIDAGEDVPFSQVVEVLKVLRKAKIERIVFASGKPAGK